MGVSPREQAKIENVTKNNVGHRDQILSREDEGGQGKINVTSKHYSEFEPTSNSYKNSDEVVEPSCKKEKTTVVSREEYMTTKESRLTADPCNESSMSVLTDRSSLEGGKVRRKRSERAKSTRLNNQLQAQK